MVLDDSKYPLHKAAFFNDVGTISSLLDDGVDIQEQDPHGNTALHISTMLGHKEATLMLLMHDAPVSKKNADGWNCLIEAVSYGNRETIMLMLRKMKEQSKKEMLKRKPHLLKMLSEFGDFYLELKWDFHSWIPLLSKVLPSDLCKIYKRGTSLRLDTTLVDLNDRSFERGDISFIYNCGTDKKSSRFFVLDNYAKVFQRIKQGDVESEFEDEVDLLMSSDMVNVHMSTKPITFERTYSGWLFRHERSEKVGEYNAQFYAVRGMSLITKKRREHLSAEDIKKNKAFMKSLAAGSILEDVKPTSHRSSLDPPEKPKITWDEYINSTPKEAPHLGRPLTQKQSSKAFNAFIAMSDEFPLTIDVLLDILEVVAPFKHLSKLRDFCEVRLPPGFPVKIEIPLLPTITAKVTFQKFMFRNDLTAKMFKIPPSYREDPSRFKDI
uniref:ANK_REP_REGION domain-containing protein n=1 Tax=Syphacia muris TaxID=451379 RepID=A0A0N5AX81_9BILA